MTGDSSSDLLTEYVALLREFGLPPEDVRELHADGNAPSSASLREFVARRVDVDSRETLFSGLVETLTQSRRGIGATASYWNYAPEVHLDEVFEPYGCSVTFRDAAHGGDGASVEIELEDAGGSSHTMRFEYPDTPLGDDNLPALLDAVERELLANTDLTFALLSDIDRRWRVVLLESARLAELRRRRGDRIEFAGRPLLAADQPPAYASGESAAAYPQPPETPAETAGTERTTTADGHAQATAVDPADLLDSGDAGNDDVADTTADPGAVLDASPAEIAADGAAEASGRSDAGVEASDEELKQVFGDLSDVSLEPTATDETGRALRPNDPPVLELGTGADATSRESGTNGDPSDRRADDAGEEPDAIDGLFEELERKAITGDGGASGGGTAVVAGAASTPAPTASVADRDVRGEDDPTLEELLAEADADEADSAAGADEADSAAGADEADSLAADDESDASGEFEWLSERELVERD